MYDLTETKKRKFQTPQLRQEIVVTTLALENPCLEPLRGMPKKIRILWYHFLEFILYFGRAATRLANFNGPDKTDMMGKNNFQQKNNRHETA